MRRVRSEICCVFPSELGWMAARWRGERLVRFTFDHNSAQEAARHLETDLSGLPLPANEAPGALPWAKGDLFVEGPLLPEHVARFQARMQRFAAGQRDDWRDIPLVGEGQTPFQRKVVAACRRIPWGETRTYAELAAQAGSPRAARAVGNVMARNRFPLIIPCHRVVGSAGGLGGFSSPNGLTTKQRLLAREKKQEPPAGACSLANASADGSA